MARYSTQQGVNQRQRTVNNPLFLGTFSETSLRYLQGTLQATYLVQKDGFGGGSYNHWFSVEITSPAWIILTKDGDRSKYVQISCYDLNLIPIEGRSIFQADSLPGTFAFDEENKTYYPYIGHVMSAQSDLYNNFDQFAVFKGDDRYYPLGAGRYLICVSSTRNEPLSYNVGLVLEFPTEDLIILLEDLDGSKLALEDGSNVDLSNTVIVTSPITLNTLISGFNAFTEVLAQINSGVTVTLDELDTWLISFSALNNEEPKDLFLLNPSPTYDPLDTHEHSRSEWTEAWDREHQQTDKFPAVFEPLITRP
jgi:hypothetical protein